jgi:hypothetical protein
MIPGQGIQLTNSQHPLELQRCDFCWQNNHATKIISTYFELMLLWWHDYFLPAKITFNQVE